MRRRRCARRDAIGGNPLLSGALAATAVDAAAAAGSQHAYASQRETSCYSRVPSRVSSNTYSIYMYSKYIYVCIFYRIVHALNNFSRGFEHTHAMCKFTLARAIYGLRMLLFFQRMGIFGAWLAHASVLKSLGLLPLRMRFHIYGQILAKCTERRAIVACGCQCQSAAAPKSTRCGGKYKTYGARIFRRHDLTSSNLNSRATRRKRSGREKFMCNTRKPRSLVDFNEMHIFVRLLLLSVTPEA